MTLRSFNLINVCFLYFNISFVVVWMPLSLKELPHLFRSLHVICVISVCFCNNNRKMNFWRWFVRFPMKIVCKHWIEQMAARRWIINTNTKNWILENCRAQYHFIVLWFTYCLLRFFFSILNGCWTERVPCQKANHQLSWTTFMAN